MAFLTWNGDVGHKLHLDCYHTLSFACLAASAVGIEGEIRCCESHLLCALCRGEELTYFIESLEVGGGIGAGGFSYGILVNKLHCTQPGYVAREFAVICRSITGIAELAVEGTVEHVAHKSRFS